MKIYDSDIDELVRMLGDSDRGHFYKNLLRMHIIITVPTNLLTVDKDVKCWKQDSYNDQYDFWMVCHRVQESHRIHTVYVSHTPKITSQQIMNYAHLVDYYQVNNIPLESLTVDELLAGSKVLNNTIELFGEIDEDTYRLIAESTISNIKE